MAKPLTPWMQAKLRRAELRTRVKARHALELFPTPAFCVYRLLEATALLGRQWCDPCAGFGHLVRAVNEVRSGIVWAVGDVREECRESLAEITPDTHIQDFLRSREVMTYSTIISHPPYSRAIDIIYAAIKRAECVAMLLRTSFMTSQKRHSFLRKRMPDVYLLPDRFTGAGKDSQDYAWFVWDDYTFPRSVGKVQVLETTTAKEKRILL